MKRTTAYRVPISFLCGVALMAVACTGVRRSPQLSPERTGDTEREPAAPAAEFDPESLMAEAESHMTTGREAYNAGDLDLARAEFDAAIELYLEAPVPVYEFPALEASFASLIEEVYELEVETWNQPAADDPLTERDLPATAPEDVIARAEAAPLDETALEAASSDVQFDLPVVYNRHVQAYLDLFQGRWRERFERVLHRSGQYVPMARRVFAEAGLPLDLVYMAQVESAWNPRAYSRARAKGMWQFMSFTGRKYGLSIDYWVDERSDPEKATRAAAAYLKDLYAMFGDWYLAMAAYNAGEGKVQRAIDRAHTRDFWKISRTRYLMRETKEFVPQILATIIIARNPEQFGFAAETAPELEWTSVEIEGFADLETIARCAETTPEVIRALNPELRRGVTPPDREGYSIKVPPDRGERFLAAYGELPEQERLAWAQHRVHRGETLSHIASRYGTSVTALMAANGIGNPRRLQIGQLLQVPTGQTSARAVSRIAAAETHAYGQRIQYRVRRGDTLSSIARRYRTTVGNLLAWNSLAGGDLIHPGQRLVVHYGVRGTAGTTASDSATELASAEVGSGSRVHTVRSGDTLFDIARLYGTTIQRLCQWNGISARKVLYPGDVLRIPGP